MKENKAKIKGDGNTVFQDIKKSRIDTFKGKEKNNTSTIIGIVIALVGVIVTIIVGWEEILSFFGI